MKITSSRSTVKTQSLYYDGTCSLCVGIVKKIHASRRGKEFDVHDISKEEIPAFLAKEQLLKEVHFVDTNGVIYRNVEAIFQILDLYPFLRPFVWVGRLPGIKHVLRAVYRIVAKYRHIFPTR